MFQPNAEHIALMAARGWRIVGSVSPDIHGATDDEVALLFPGDIKGVLRDLRNRALPAVEPQIEVAS